MWIVTAKQRYLATQSLRKIEEKLEADQFPASASQRARQRRSCSQDGRVEQ